MNAKHFIEDMYEDNLLYLLALLFQVYLPVQILIHYFGEEPPKCSL